MASGIDKLGTAPARVKRSQASLFGGIASGIGVFIIVLLLAGGPSPLSIAIGLAIGAALGVWVRLADL
jgi:hypothetical protein